MIELPPELSSDPEFMAVYRRACSQLTGNDSALIGIIAAAFLLGKRSGLREAGEIFKP